ncbi:MAG: PAS domain S-box protein [Bacteroidales bacterium]|nr:PAS domain S-box protein [Bacteroidales bacterium]
MNTESEGYRKTAELPGVIRFIDIFDPDEIQQIQDVFSAATGVASLIAGSGGFVSKPGNFSSRFIKISSENNSGYAACGFSGDFAGVDTQNSLLSSSCNEFGLWQACAEISFCGSHIANWYIGLVRDAEPDFVKATEYACDSGIDAEEYMQALKELKVMPREQFAKVTALLNIYAKDLSEKADSSYQLKQKMAATQKAGIHEEEDLQRFKSIVQNMPRISVQGYKPDGTTFYWNKASEELYGYTAEEAIGRKLTDLIIPPEMVGTVEEAIVQMAVTGQPIPASELMLMRKDRTSVSVFSSHSIIKVQGKPQELFCIDVDLTELRRTEQMLRASEEKYRLLVENAGIAVGVYSADGRILFYNQKAVEPLGGIVEDYIGKSLKDVFGNDIAEIYARRFREVASCGHSIEYEDHVSLPDGKSYWFQSNNTRIQGPDGETTGILLLSHNITERKMAEAMIEKERLLFRTLIDNIPDAIYSKDLDFRKTLANLAEVRFMGVNSEEEVLGKSDFDFYPEDVAARFLADDKKVVATGKPILNGEEFFLDEHGRKRWLLSSKIPLRGRDGEITGLVGIGRDITDRKMAEEALRESEEKYRFLFQHLNTGFALHEIILDSKGRAVDYRFIQVNSAFESMTGLKAEEVIGKTAIEVMPDTEPFWIETYAEVAKTGKPAIFEHFSQVLNKHYQVNSYSPGVGKFATIFLDITERKNADEALRFSEEKYRLLIENANEAIYVVQDQQVVFANRVCEEVTGINHDNLIGISILELVDEVNRKELALHHLDLIEGRLNSHSSLFSVKNHKGGERWLSVNSVRIEWNGSPATLNMGTDITEKKKTDELLRENEERFRSIFENVQDVFFQTDLDGIICEISPSIKHFSQFDKNELLGSQVADLYANPDERIILLGTLFKHGELRDYELKLKTKSGEEVFASLNARMILDKEGKPTHVDGSLRDITGRKKAETALQKSYDLLNNLTAMVPGVVYQYQLFPDGRSCFPVSSRGMYDIYEVTPEEVRTDASIVFTRLHPDDRDGLVETILESARTQTLFRSDFRVVLPEKGIRWRHCDARPELLEDGSTLWYGIISDITESKQAEEALVKFQTAIKNSKTSIIITDGNGLIEYANPYFSETSGYTWEEIAGKSPGILQSGFHSSVFYDELWKTIQNGKTWEGEFLNKKKNGQLFWENAIISPIRNAKDEITHFVGIKTDITASKKIKEELINAKEQAEESDRLKSAFLANMSHEIRTPMNGILGFTELLKTPGLTGEEQQEYIQIIKKSGDRMLNIINDIIDISKIESGQMSVSVSDTNVNEVIEYIFNFFKPETEQKGVRFSYFAGLPVDDAVIKTDREKIYAILTNLVKNAIKFTKTGFIEFGYIRKDKNLEFFVSDSGTGIPDEHKSFIFERFRQGSESLIRNYEGAGLGLSISKAYIELLGGEIWVESEPGKGSAFYFNIPYNAEKTEGFSVRVVNPSEDSDARAAGFKILIVEDDEISDMFLNITLKNLSRGILHAATGQEALDIVKENPDLDLVLMDIKIPVFDGYETTRRIRAFNKRW